MISEENQYDLILKLIFLGPYLSGKTSLLYRITKYKFQTGYQCTIGRSLETKYLEIDNLKIKAQIWDTAGEEKFTPICSQVYYRGASGIFLAFDLSSEESFKDVQLFYKERLVILTPDIPTILVGCKSDLVEKRAVSYDVAQSLANDLGISYIETSAKENRDCMKVLETLSRMAIAQVKYKDEVKIQPKLNISNLKYQKEYENKKCF